MIRCYPVDGSEPFEVENETRLDRFDGDHHIISTADAMAGCAPNYAMTWMPRLQGRAVECRIESWRERAERLERYAPSAEAMHRSPLVHALVRSGASPQQAADAIEMENARLRTELIHVIMHSPMPVAIALGRGEA